MEGMRFSIRDMLWLTALAALAACWISDRHTIFEMKDRLKAEQEQLQTRLKAEQEVAQAEAAASRAVFEDYRRIIKTLDSQVRLYEQLTPPPTQLRRDD
jgi:hypothetical protein